MTATPGWSDPTRICVYGAGAVGGHIAARLTASDADVSVIARGANLTAIQQNGLRVETRDGVLTAHPAATADPHDLPPQDVVIVTVKAPALPAIAENLGDLLHEQSIVVFVTNGVPWWYFHAEGGDWDGTELRRLDPDRALAKHIGAHRAVGAVAYTACTVLAPGIIRAENPRNRLILGRPDGQPDPRLDTLASLLNPTGLEVTVTPRIRDAVWAKLMMNIIGGSIGALTASPMKDALDKPAIAAAAALMADEGAAIARALRCDPGNPTDGLAKLATSTHLQSIGQDLLAGRAMEIDALFRVPLDIARLTAVPTPNLDLVVDLVTQRARAAGLYTDTAA